MYIGDKIKELRKQKNMTLLELSKTSGVQIATLSRIEHKKMVGTLESHIKIAQALGVDITSLYANIREGSPKDREKEKKLAESFVHNDRASIQILTTRLMNKKMMPVLIRLEAGGKTTPEENQLGTEKFIFVLDGKLEVTAGKEKTLVSKNGSLYFDASLPHFFTNAGQSVTKALCVCTPVAL
jgi:transcriptional regulator with XRE-family HTH domain